MKNLLKAGYGYSVRVSCFSNRGTHIINFWGFACPLWWIGPSYDMETILRNGAFGSKDRVVIGQAETIEELEEQLLDKANRSFPDPFKLSNGEDVRQIYPQMYKKGE